jgi:hypothetical protein
VQATVFAVLSFDNGMTFSSLSSSVEFSYFDTPVVFGIWPTHGPRVGKVRVNGTSGVEEQQLYLTVRASNIRARTVGDLKCKIGV